MSTEEQCIEDADGSAVLCCDIACAMITLISLWLSFMLDSHSVGAKANKQAAGTKAKRATALRSVDELNNGNEPYFDESKS